MNNNYEKIRQLYIITEMKYVDNFSDMEEKEIFPIDWYSMTNYIKKIEILGEAIKKCILIKDTNKYKEFVKTLRR